nr:hypothetical protein [Tanacetum cinerariifolium]
MRNMGDAAMEGRKAISRGNTGDEGAADKEVIGPDVVKTLNPPYLIQSGSLSMKNTGRSCILMFLVIRLRAKMVVILRMEVNRKLEANVPNDVDYDVWLPLASVHEVMAVSNLEGTGYAKKTICVEYESEPPCCSTCLIFGHSHEDCPKSPKRVVNMIDKGKVGSSRADDKCFIRVKKKKSGCYNRGNKNFKSVLVKPKIQYHPKAKQSTKGASLKTSPYVGKKNFLTLGYGCTTISVSTDSSKGNFRDAIDVGVDVVHPVLVVAVAFLADMSTLRLRMGKAETENASLHGKIRTMKAIETVTRIQERRAHMEMERQLASSQPDSLFRPSAQKPRFLTPICKKVIHAKKDTRVKVKRGWLLSHLIGMRNQCPIRMNGLLGSFMAITKDEPSVGKADARLGQWVEITMKKTSSKVTLDQLLTKQVPGNIVSVLGKRDRRKEQSSSKEVLFTKADESSTETALEITPASKSECDFQESLSPLPKLRRGEPTSTSIDVLPLADLTQTSAVFKKIKRIPKKGSAIKAPKKRTRIALTLI